MGCGWRATTAADTLHRETREKMVGGWRIVPFVRLIHHHAVLSTRLPVADFNWNSCSCVFLPLTRVPIFFVWEMVLYGC
jgi:hypothetical protein